MFDAFPYEEWSEEITTFWTFGVEGDTGTIILTILGVLFMIGSLIQFVRLESQKLDAQTATLRRALAAAEQSTTTTVTVTTITTE
ncbi:MAG: LPXTG cell wall anchor domain-containing protein [Gaiella sp.]